MVGKKRLMNLVKIRDPLCGIRCRRVIVLAPELKAINRRSTHPRLPKPHCIVVARHFGSSHQARDSRLLNPHSFLWLSFSPPPRRALNYLHTACPSGNNFL